MNTIAVVTGSRAEFGLLRSTMRGIDDHVELTLRTIVTGTHLLRPALTIADIQREFAIHCEVAMQREGVTGRAADAQALGRGVIGLSEALSMLQPDVVLVLGDRIEALAGALAASITGLRLAHVHGGDRAEGIADESMRHAITKLAHIHFPATDQSARRIIDMGEPAERVHVVGSPAIDGLADIPPMPDNEFAALCSPEILFLMHPDNEATNASAILTACAQAGRTLALHPNHDPGRDAILDAIERSGCAHIAHLPRCDFIGLLKRVRVLVGNSSAGLIEAAALGLPVVNIGPRQRGRESAANVVHVMQPAGESLRHAIDDAMRTTRRATEHPFGDGRAGQRIADHLARLNPARLPLAKSNAY